MSSSELQPQAIGHGLGSVSVARPFGLFYAKALGSQHTTLGTKHR
jgi:hypothetical protein